MLSTASQNFAAAALPPAVPLPAPGEGERSRIHLRIDADGSGHAAGQRQPGDAPEPDRGPDGVPGLEEVPEEQAVRELR